MSERTGSYICNICNWKGVAFLERDASLVCPQCFSRQRHRSIYQYLKENNMLVGNSCLDVASRGIFQRRLSYADYVTIDKMPGFAEHTMDVCELKFTQDQFDLIICCSVLQFVSEYERALEEMNRVLKPNGTCIIQIPYDKSIDKTYIMDKCTSRSRNKDHSVCFSYNDINKCLEKKFMVKRCLYEDPCFAFSQQEFFVCCKMKSK